MPESTPTLPCHGLQDLFFPSEAEIDHRKLSRSYDQAYDLCMTCPVLQECAQKAMEIHDRHTYRATCALWTNDGYLRALKIARGKYSPKPRRTTA